MARHSVCRTRRGAPPGPPKRRPGGDGGGRLAEGSGWGEVAWRAAIGPSRKRNGLQLREIRARVKRSGHRGRGVRLWTRLLDPQTAPPIELPELYARRWEHELYYRE